MTCKITSKLKSQTLGRAFRNDSEQKGNCCLVCDEEATMSGSGHQ